MWENIKRFEKVILHPYIDTKGYIYNGYNSLKNELIYNSNSNLIGIKTN